MREIKLVTKNNLSETDFAEIERLNRICREFDHCELKINWDFLHNRDQNLSSDFFAQVGTETIAYLELDGFGDKYEITGIVIPEYRHKGIFSQLLAQAYQEVQKRGGTSLLLVNYRASAAGIAFAKAKGYPYLYSEYRMEAYADTMPVLSAPDIELHLVKFEDILEFSRLLNLAFPGEGGNSLEQVQKRWEEPNARHFFARLNGDNIGQIAAINEGNGIYIGAVGIVPELRGKGYGRQLLAATLNLFLKEGHQEFRLDVETENENALSLYKTCGFKTINIYDYYNIVL
jgi:ribosomal protein S18 acetylase RimI-like enzyme